VDGLTKLFLRIAIPLLLISPVLIFEELRAVKAAISETNDKLDRLERILVRIEGNGHRPWPPDPK